MLKRRMIMIALAALLSAVFLPDMNSAGGVAYANKGDKITLKVDEKIHYGGAFTSKLEVTDTTADMEDAEGRYVYCVQPSKYTPGPGEYTIDKEYTDDTGGKGARIRKLLYYSKGFAGYSKHGGKAVWSEEGFSGDMAYVAAHLCLSYLYQSDEWADDFWGFSSEEKAAAKRAMNKLLSNEFDDPPESFRCFVIMTSGYQDYIGGYYEQKGFLKLIKKSALPHVSDGNGIYRLKGAKYGVYSSAGDAAGDDDRVGTLTTGEDGTTNTLEVLKGTYYVKELAESEGYARSTDVQKVSVEPNETAVIKTGPALEIPKNGMFSFSKNDLITGGSPQGDASFAGTEFTVKHYGNAEGNTQGSVLRTFVLKAGADGAVKCDSAHLSSGQLASDSRGAACAPLGTYLITEKTPGPGYLASSKSIKVIIRDRKQDDTSEKDVTVTYSYDGASASSSAVFPDDVIRGDIYIEKHDKELDKSEAMAGREHSSDGAYPDLSGIRFTVSNASEHDVIVPAVLDPNDEGYKIIDWKNKTAVTAALSDGSAKKVAPGGEIGIITIRWNEEKKAYEAHTQDRALPYGTYEITETKTNRFYDLTDPLAHVAVIREDGKTTDADKNGDLLTWKDYVYRQNLRFAKIGKAGNKQERLAFVPFRITNLATGKYIYAVTDKNGQYDSSLRPHDRNTNGYDSYIDETLSSGGIVDSEKLREMMLGDEIDETAAGTWFGWGEDGSYAEPDNDLAAFPFGTYKIEEVRCTGNEKYVLTEPMTFLIGKPDKDRQGSGFPNLNTAPGEYGGVDLQNIVNETGSDEPETPDGPDKPDKPKIPHIRTTATVKGKHVVSSDETVIIKDKVKYSGLEEGKTYTIEGILMDKKTEKPIRINGKEIVSSDVFTPKKDSGTVMMKFKADAKVLAGKTTVVFETVSYKGVKTAEHADINDKGQTVEFRKKEKKTEEKRPSPKTGDDSNIPVIMMICFVSLWLAGLARRNS